jgi:hypothetical protein
MESAALPVSRVMRAAGLAVPAAAEAPASVSLELREAPVVGVRAASPRERGESCDPRRRHTRDGSAPLAAPTRDSKSAFFCGHGA